MGYYKKSLGVISYIDKHTQAHLHTHSLEFLSDLQWKKYSELS